MIPSDFYENQPIAVPQNVRATADSSSVTVSFDAVAHARSYDILFDNKVTNVTTTSRKYTGLQPKTSHTYAVRAKTTKQTSAYSTTRTIQTLANTPAGTPAVPSGVKKTATDSTVTIRWDAVSGATGYDILFDGRVYSITSTRKEFTSLTAGKSYTYQIRSKNGNTVSAYTASDEDASDYEVEFDGVTSAAAADGQEGEAFAARSLADQGMSRRFAGLQPGTEHTYRVRAGNAYGFGEYSSLQRITTSTGRRNGMPSAKKHVTYPDGRLSFTGLDPVNAITGSFLWSCTLLEDYGRDALQFTLMYDSQRDEHETFLGKGWTHALHYSLYQDERYFYFGTPYDEVTAFAKEEGGSILMPDLSNGADYRLERKDDGSISVKDPGGAEYCFDDRQQLTEIRENGLLVFRFEVQEPNQPEQSEQTVRVTGRHGGWITLSYAGGHLIKAADALGNEVTLTLEGEFLTFVTNSAGRQMSFVYDEDGRLAKIGDFSGNIYLENQYDSLGRTVSQTMAGRGVSTVSYSGSSDSGGCTSFTDEEGNVRNYYYNQAGNVTEIEFMGSSIRSSYNERGQVTEQIDALGNKTQTAYDDAGRMNLITYPDLTTERIFYNERNLPEKMVNRDGTESSYTYDEKNNLITVLDERGNSCSYDYDEQDNLTSFTDKEGGRWQYAYDENRHLCQALDPEGNCYKYVHDAIGRLTSYTTPAGKTTTYEYSAAGELLKIVDADGSQLFAYDDNGRCTDITDKMGNSQKLAYNAMGQLVLVTDFLGREYRFTYDARGNLLTETDPLGYQTEYGYDAFENRVSRKDQNGGVTRFRFDADNRLTQVKDAAGGTVSYTYNNMGEVTAVTDPLSHRTTFAYDRRGHVVSRTDALGNSVSYTYDQAGNILTVTDEDGVVTTYGYDRESRLVSIETAAAI